ERVVSEAGSARMALLIRGQRLVLHAPELRRRKAWRSDHLRAERQSLREYVLERDYLSGNVAESTIRIELRSQRIHLPRELGTRHVGRAFGEQPARERCESVFRRRLPSRACIYNEPPAH